MPTRSLKQIEAAVEEWIADSAGRFSSRFLEAGKVWVLKFIDARFLAGFLSRGQLVVSTTAGFTWGDGIYVAPICNEYSTMMYGRIGVLGWIDASNASRVYDAGDSFGVQLYQEWIQHLRVAFRILTTTIHADRANRVLRNAFRRKFKIDVVLFPPDQFNRSYVNPSRDRWFVVSDWSGAGSSLKCSRCWMHWRN